MDEKKFNALLKKRYTPEAPSNLATRIIDESRRETRKETRFDLKAKLGDLLGVFIAPKPAFALAFILVLAIGLGVFGGDIVDIDDESQNVGDVSMAFYVDDIFGYEDYL